MRSIPALVSACLLLSFSGQSYAVGCVVSNVVNPSFVPLPQLQASQPTAQGSFDVICDKTTDLLNVLPVNGQLNLVISLGAGASNDYNNRHSGSVGPTYNLFTDSGRTQVWGNGNSNGTVTLSRTMTFGLTEFSKTEHFDVYAKVQAQIQKASAGLTYSDTLGINVSY